MDSGLISGVLLACFPLLADLGYRLSAGLPAPEPLPFAAALALSLAAICLAGTLSRRRLERRYLATALLADAPLGAPR